MKIHGLNNLTLLDYPGKMACTVFTGSCNLRCPFCHNASLVLRPSSQPLISESEIFDLLKNRKGRLEGVCITGGEPTLNKDLPAFCEKIKDLGFLVKLDTNGTNPIMLKTLLNRGLIDYAAMDIKSSLSGYPAACGIEGFDTSAVCDSVDILRNAEIESEFRTTVVGGIHTAETMEEQGRWLQGAQRLFLQSFKDSGDLIDPSSKGVDKKTMEQFREILSKYIDNVEIRGI